MIIANAMKLKEHQEIPMRVEPLIENKVEEQKFQEEEEEEHQQPIEHGRNYKFFLTFFFIVSH